MTKKIEAYEPGLAEALGISVEKSKHGGTLIVVCFIALVLLGVLLDCAYTVNAGERAILLTFGNPNMIPNSEGLHFKAPLIQSVVIMDIKTQKYEADLAAASKDLQDVATKIALNYHLDEGRVPEIYKSIGINYADKVIMPIEQETNKAITAQYTAEELITKREEVRTKMRDALIEKLVSRGIIIEEMSIINFKFSDSFTTAIENKVTAEQNALGAKNKLEQVKFEAQQRVSEAQGKADAMRIEIQALQTNPQILQLRAIEKWNGNLPLVTGTGGTPFIDISQFTKTGA